MLDLLVGAPERHPDRAEELDRLQYHHVGGERDHALLFLRREADLEVLAVSGAAWDRVPGRLGRLRRPDVLDLERFAVCFENSGARA